MLDPEDNLQNIEDSENRQDNVDVNAEEQSVRPQVHASSITSSVRKHEISDNEIQEIKGSIGNCFSENKFILFD